MKEVKTTEDLFKLFNKQFPEDGDPDEKPLRYVIYARKSTDEKDKQQHSLDDQIRDCFEFANKNNLILSRPKIIQESVSAKESGIRMEFNRMIESVKGGKVDGIIAWHPNRLSRNMKEAGEIIDLLDKGILKDLKFPAHTFTNDSSGKMLLGITFVMSKQYSDNLSTAVRRGNSRSVSAGALPSSSKHGYIRDVNGYLRPDGRNYSLLKEAFEMRLAGHILEDIAIYLNENNYERKTKKFTYKSRMTKQSVKKVLQNPFYAGILVHGENVVNLLDVAGYDFIPAVTVEEFMKINSIKEGGLAKFTSIPKRGKHNKSILLRGKVFCDKCGEIRSTGISKGKYFFFRCGTDDCPSKNKSTRAKVILDFVKGFFDSQPFSNIESYESYKTEISRVNAMRLKNLNSELGGLGERLRNNHSRLSTLREKVVLEDDPKVKQWGKDDIAKAERSISELDTKMILLKEKIKAQKKAPLAYKEFLELFETMAKNIAETKSMATLDKLLSKVFSNFTTSKKNVEDYELNEPFASLLADKEGKVSVSGR